MGHHDDALGHLRLAVKIDPHLAQAWNSIGLVAYDRAELAVAELAYREALRQKPQFAAGLINLANALQSQNRRPEAITALRQTLQIEPDNPIALANLGQVLADTGDPALLDEAEARCRRALVVGPKTPHALSGLGNVLRLRGRVNEAIACYQQALEIRPRREVTRIASHQVMLRDRGLAAAHHGLGLTLLEIGRLDDAEHCFREALNVDSTYAVSWVALARVYAERGEFDLSCQSARAALAIDPKLVPAYGRLALILKGRMPEDEVSRMRQPLEFEHLSDEHRAMVHFSLAAVLDDRGLYSEAAAHLESANRLQAASDAARGQSYDADQNSEYIDRLIAAFTAEFLAARRGWGIAEERPLFVLGLPRSGTTLIEQILASHPQIHGAGELKDVDRLFQSIPAQTTRTGLTAFEALRQLTIDSTQALARQYLERLDSLAPMTARWVVQQDARQLSLARLYRALVARRTRDRLSARRARYCRFLLAKWIPEFAMVQQLGTYGAAIRGLRARDGTLRAK